MSHKRHPLPSINSAGPASYTDEGKSEPREENGRQCLIDTVPLFKPNVWLTCIQMNRATSKMTPLWSNERGNSLHTKIIKCLENEAELRRMMFRCRQHCLLALLLLNEVFLPKIQRSRSAVWHALTMEFAHPGKLCACVCVLALQWYSFGTAASAPAVKKRRGTARMKDSDRHRKSKQTPFRD